jgi:hypothetical protein
MKLFCRELALLLVMLDSVEPLLDALDAEALLLAKELLELFS